MNTSEFIAIEGQNCWQRLPASRLKVFLDSASYFNAFADTVEQAQRSILIVGWDIHSQVRLRRDNRTHTYPVELGALLNAVAAANKSLQIYILTWDFAMIYVLERETFPLYRFQWRTHKRIHFKLDNHHPVGACHHQKIVVIDHQVAFVGGIDLSQWRWDTRDHLAQHEQRVDPSGRVYPPFHDLQFMVEGPVAAALGDLVRQRWQQATGKTISRPQVETSPWPYFILPELENIEVSIARTYPRWKKQHGIREVEALYLDAIAAAQKFIYIENQYLTSAAISEALIQRLHQADSPEIVIVLPYEASGWMEEYTMDVLRARILKKLAAADKQGKFKVYYPSIIEAKQETFVKVHAKIMLIDNRFLRIGSSNLSNRSMGVDTECDLAIEAGTDITIQKQIAHYHHEILSTHLDVAATEIQAHLAQSGSLVASIEQLRGKNKTLRQLKPKDYSSLEAVMPDTIITDPEKTIDPDELVDKFLASDRDNASKGWIMKIVAPIFILLALAAMWRWTPINQWLELPQLFKIAQALEGNPWSFFIIIGGFVFGSLIMIPLTVMIVLSSLIYGPLQGFIYSIVGALIAAALGFVMGRFFWRDTLRQLAGKQVNVLSNKLNQQNIFTVAALRLVPIAPFTIVNMVAGSIQLRFKIFILGTFLGMVPGILGLIMFSDQLVEAIKRPNINNIIMAISIFIVIIIVGLLFKRFFKKQLS